MVNVMLTESMIKAGEALITKLDDRGVSPDAAFWIYFPDIEQWKLMLAEIKLGEIGPKEFYKKIQATISANRNEIGDLALNDVVLAKSDAPIVALLRMAIRTGRGINGIRFTNGVINGTVIEDAYIYRLA